MAVIDLDLPKPTPFLERNGKLMLVCSAVWLASVLVFSTATWVDRSLLGAENGPYIAHFLGWLRGMVPWLFLGPIVYRFGARYSNQSVQHTLRSAAAAGAICMIIVGSWAAFAFSIGTPYSPIDVIASFRMMDWMWDITFYVVIFLIGRQMRPREMASGLEQPKPADIAVRSHDRVEYIPVHDVLGATAQGNYIALHLENRDVLHRATMSSLADTLADAGFVRIHRSHMVNPDCVVSAAARGERVKAVSLRNGIKLPVSERYNDDVVTRLNGRVCA